MRGLKQVNLVPFQRRQGRTPQGVRGLKLRLAPLVIKLICRTPQGVRGLKQVIRFYYLVN